VGHAVVHALVPERLPDAPPGERLKGRGADELGPGRGEHDINSSPRLDQQANQFGRLVGRHPTGHPQHDAPALKFAHDIKIPPIGNQRGF
jgi:hypothetical protein